MSILIFSILLTSLWTPISAIEVRTYKLQQKTLPEASWTLKESFQGVKSLLECAAMTMDKDAYFYSYDSAGQICETGTADVSAAGSGSKKVILGSLSQFSKVGMFHGNANGALTFDILLPNGVICPAADVGIPDTDFGRRRSHGIAEFEGVIYVVQGIDTLSAVYLKTNYKLDLNVNNPSWVKLANAPVVGAPTNGGLVPYESSSGQKSLFVSMLSMCTTGASSGHFLKYDIASDSWTTVGKATLPHVYMGSVVQDNNFLYLVGGRTCLSPYVWSKKIQRFNMELPTQDTVVLEHTTCTDDALLNTACTLYYLDGQKGILCAGGTDTITQTNHVQFVAMNEDGTTQGTCTELDPMPGRKAYAFLFNYGQGQLVLYGGNDGSQADATSPAIFLWDSASQTFVDSGMSAARSVSNPGFNYISADLVMKNCWQYL